MSLFRMILFPGGDTTANKFFLNPKSTGLFSPGTALEGGGGSENVNLDQDILES